MNALTVIDAKAAGAEVVDGCGLFLERNPFEPNTLRYLGGIPEGSPLSAYAERALEELPVSYAEHLDLYVGEHRIDRVNWGKVKPKPTAEVRARVRPRGKGGKNILRAVLIIAVVVAATLVFTPAAGGMVAGWATSLGISAAALSAALIAATVMVATLAINALIPPPKLLGETNTKDPRYQLTGSNNRFVPYGPVPRVFGKIRMFPTLAARPYTEIVGKQQFLRILLNVGWGPIKVSDIRIGNTDITAFRNVEIEVHEGGPAGWAGNAPITLYNRKVTELGVSIQTLYNVPSVFQTTTLNTVEIGVDIAFPQGLIEYDNEGDRMQRSVNHRVEYRAVGSGTWLSAPLIADGDNTVTGNIMTTKDMSQDAVRRSNRFKVPEGQYEVRLTRTTPAGIQQTGGHTQVDDSYWTTLRCYSTDQAVVQEGVCLVAIRMQATDQLNGVPDTINMLAEAYVPVRTAGVWNYALTRNPAWAYADLFRRRGNAPYLADGRLDLTTIEAWAADCAATAPNAAEPRWTYDGVVEGGSVIDAARQIASIGRAAFTIKDGRFSVARDKEQLTPVQHITPRNSWGYSGTRMFVDLPHALKIEFQNAEQDYRLDELIVYRDGYSAANATKFEVLQLFGCTSPKLAFREGRYHLAVGTLRAEEHRVNMDIEALRCTLGDRVQFAHDVILVGTGYGRITGRNTSGANTIAFVLDEEVMFEAGKTYQLRVRHSDGSTSIRTVTHPGSIANPTETVLVVAEPTAAAPTAGDLFMFGETGIESMPCIVKRIEPGDDLSATLTLVPYDPAIYTADTGTIPPFTSYLTPDPRLTPPAPPLVTLRSNDTVTVIGSDGTVFNRIGVDLAARSDPIKIRHYEVQFRDLGADQWYEAGSWPPSTTTVYCAPIRDGYEYQVRARALGENGLYSPWVQPANHTVIGRSWPPLEPTAVTVTPGYRQNIIRWTEPGDLDLAFVEVLASQVNNSGTAVVVGRSSAGTFTHDNLTGGATWYYWLRAVDAASNVSPLTAVQSGTALSLSAFEGIGSDGILHPTEKIEVFREHTQLNNEWTGIITQADALAVSRVAYTNALTALNTYVAGLSPSWTDTTQSTPVVRATWNTNWQAVYSARQALLNALDAKAATMAAWTSVTLRPDNLAALTGEEGILNSEVAFAPRKTFTFATTTEGWSALGATLSWAAGGTVTLDGTTADPQFNSPTLAVPGRTNYLVRARIRATTASVPWEGALYYSTPGHAFTAGFYKLIPQPAGWATSEWCIVEWDMRTLNAGGGDYTAETINALRFDFHTSTANVEIDWVSIGDINVDVLVSRGVEDGATYGAPVGSNVGGVPAEDVADVTDQFNGRLNRLGDPITPAISGATVTYIPNTDGTVDVVLSWDWDGNEDLIDGFSVMSRVGSTHEGRTGPGIGGSEFFSGREPTRALIPINSSR